MICCKRDTIGGTVPPLILLPWNAHADNWIENNETDRNSGITHFRTCFRVTGVGACVVHCSLNFVRDYATLVFEFPGYLLFTSCLIQNIHIDLVYPLFPLPRQFNRVVYAQTFKSTARKCVEKLEDCCTSPSAIDLKFEKFLLKFLLWVQYFWNKIFYKSERNDWKTEANK